MSESQVGWVERPRKGRTHPERSQRHRRRAVLSNKPRFSPASITSILCVLAPDGALACTLTVGFRMEVLRGDVTSHVARVGDAEFLTKFPF